MTGDFLRRLREPRYGMVFFSMILAALMAAHWPPMLIPALAGLALGVLRRNFAVRPVVMWLMAGLWGAAAVFERDRMEDHVYLFLAWLVALAVSLSYDKATFLDRAAWHARVLVGVTFLTAITWKIYFGSFAGGTTLWTFILVDKRFQPMANMLGLPGAAVDQDRIELAKVLDGTLPAMHLDASSFVTSSITTVAVLTLLLEAVIAASHLAPDSHRLAALRLPSVVLFGIVTYGVVPVVPFAALLATLTMVVGRWRTEIWWVFPLLVIVSCGRLASLSW